jgi:hypothetical protein
MKKVLVGLIAVAMVASLGFAQTEVESVNVVGFNKITIEAGELALVTPPFESFGDATLEDLVGDQLPQGSGAFIWDRANSIYIASSRTKAGWSGTNVIHRGDGFWLSNAGAEPATVALMGEVPADYNNSATTTVSEISGTDAVGYAYPTDIVWTNTTLAQTVDSGSGLFIWDEDGQTYAAYSKTKAGWSTPEGFALKAGRAFWISTSTPVDWTEIAPYDL